MIFVKSLLFVLLAASNLNSSTSLTVEETDDDSSCRVAFVKLVCLQTEGLATADKIYFKFKIDDQAYFVDDGRYSMNNGGSLDMSSISPISIQSSMTIQLWDDDFFDSDDHLGTQRISCNASGLGYRKLRFTEDGAEYELTYIVN